MTKRQKIAETFKAGLQTITTANLYRTTFPTVQHWASNIEPEENTKIVNIKDRMINNAEDARGEEERINIEILLGCCIANTNYATIVNMIDDIKKWYGTNRETIITAINLVDIKFISEDLEVGRNESGKEIGAGKVVFSVITGQHANWIFDSTEY